MKLLLFLTLLYCLYKGKMERNIFNPYYFFSVTPFSLLIYSSAYAPAYLSVLSEKTLALALTNMIAFLFTLTLTKKVKPKKIFEIGYNNIIVNSLLLFAISMVPKIFRLLFSSDMIFYSVISLYFYTSLSFAIFSKNKFLIALIVTYTLITRFYSFNRTGFMFFLIVSLVAVYKNYNLPKKLNLKLAVLLLTSLLLLFITFHYRDHVRAGGNFFTYISEGYKTTNLSDSVIFRRNTSWNYPNFLYMPYLYMTTPWNNLQYVTETQNTRTYGLWSLKPILGYLQLDDQFEKYYQLTPTSFFNTFSFISVLFKDFGYIGSLIGSLFLGWFVKKVYLLYKISNSPFINVSYGLVLCAVLQMYFSNHFFMQSYPFSIFLVNGLYVAFMRYFKILLPR